MLSRSDSWGRSTDDFHRLLSWAMGGVCERPVGDRRRRVTGWGSAAGEAIAWAFGWGDIGPTLVRPWLGCSADWVAGWEAGGAAWALRRLARMGSRTRGARRRHDGRGGPGIARLCNVPMYRAWMGITRRRRASERKKRPTLVGLWLGVERVPGWRPNLPSERANDVCCTRAVGEARRHGVSSGHGRWLGGPQEGSGVWSVWVVWCSMFHAPCPRPRGCWRSSRDLLIAVTSGSRVKSPCNGHGSHYVIPYHYVIPVSLQDTIHVNRPSIHPSIHPHRMCPDMGQRKRKRQ